MPQAAGTSPAAQCCSLTDYIDWHYKLVLAEEVAYLASRVLHRATIGVAEESKGN